MDSLSELLSKLKTASRSVERNSLAVKAAETGDSAVPRILVDLIDRPDLANEPTAQNNCTARDKGADVRQMRFPQLRDASDVK
jgi:hypothetical protein